MTVILKFRDENETTAIPQTVHGYVVEMFDTVKEFKEYLIDRLHDLEIQLRNDGLKDERLEKINERAGAYSFNVLMDKYLEYNFNEVIEII